jgi:excisionase family DNA binding protein
MADLPPHRAKGLIERPLEDTIDVHTAARIAAVSDGTVRRWCDEGRIACCKPAGRWRVFRTQFLAWIESSVSNPAQLPMIPTRSAETTRRRELYG